MKFEYQAVQKIKSQKNREENKLYILNDFYLSGFTDFPTKHFYADHFTFADDSAS